MRELDPGHAWSGDPAALVDALDELAALFARPAWHADAACRGAGPDDWYPVVRPGVRLEVAVAQARAVCAGCSVRAACLADAEGRADDIGMWGGLSGRERRQARKDAA